MNFSISRLCFRFLLLPFSLISRLLMDDRVHIPGELGRRSDASVPRRRESRTRAIARPATSGNSRSARRRSSVNEPVIAFGPPGSTGELNVSVIVSLVPPDFKIEAFGGAEEVGDAVVRAITGSARRPEVKGTLIQSSLREDRLSNVNYYDLEFRVESPSFHRHNVAVCCARGGRLFTLNAQAPESAWTNVSKDFRQIAKSFRLTS
ncbi:unnamed protein product [Linum tenue]|uniref:PsbP C-terminal domain-containing protein n=1 Tax=Linum tenue TaxID=586396 RepID=A0AAV0R435_9ROSI|nr:unnamed protein product [Linum tenue]